VTAFRYRHECVELAETSPPTAVKDALSRFKEMPAQSAFEEFAKSRKSTQATQVFVRRLRNRRNGARKCWR
jgi:hypothetical protein